MSRRLKRKVWTMSEYTKTVCSICGKRLSRIELNEYRGICLLCYKNLLVMKPKDGKFYCSLLNFEVDNEFCDRCDENLDYPKGSWWQNELGTCCFRISLSFSRREDKKNIPLADFGECDEYDQKRLKEARK